MSLVTGDGSNGAQDVVPLGEEQVGPGEHVHATDGEIGQVRGFLVDGGTRRSPSRSAQLAPYDRPI
jgi:hypothetical protein